jgi:2'-5' RNA ligase
MRLFIATDLPEQVIESLSVMREQVGSAHDRVRWVPSESLHLTLKFLGEVPDKRIRRIDESLKCIQISRFEVEVAGVGFFPNEHAPRVFWAGVRSTTLVQLADKVGGLMVELGFKSERRPFRPHLTLARARGNARIEGRFVEQARSFRDREFGTLETDRFFLYESQLGPSGAVYTRLGEYQLGPDSGRGTIKA